MESLRLNPLLQTDSYKLTHWWQYPPDTQYVYSYLSSRGGFFKHTMFFGLQGILKENFTGKVFDEKDIVEAEALAATHFGSKEVFNSKGWRRLLEKHSGWLPLKICAVPEGTVVPVKNALMTIENLDPEFPWLTNWAETLLLQVWYPITVATLSFEIKQTIGKDLVRTGNPALLPFKLHDFGFRGVSSPQTAARGGAAHLVNFLGTDTLAAIGYLRQYYHADMPGFSIPAMEHSTVTSWGQQNEGTAFANMLHKTPLGLMAACVIDSFDTHAAVEDIFCGPLREEIMRRGATVVLRPDSGDPTIVLEDIFNIVAERYGFETNAKGWKVLPACVRVIQGDGVNYQNILRINSHLTRAGWSMDNWAYGMGGALLQQQNRDTMRFAIKCSAICRDGTWYPVHKNPKTDASKASIGGRFSLVEQGDGRYTTLPRQDEALFGDQLQTVLVHGKLVRDESLDRIRERAASFDRYEEEVADYATA